MKSLQRFLAIVIMTVGLSSGAHALPVFSVVNLAKEKIFATIDFQGGAEFNGTLQVGETFRVELDSSQAGDVVVYFEGSETGHIHTGTATYVATDGFAALRLVPNGTDDFSWEELQLSDGVSNASVTYTNAVKTATYTKAEGVLISLCIAIFLLLSFFFAWRLGAR